VTVDCSFGDVMNVTLFCDCGKHLPCDGITVLLVCHECSFAMWWHDNT
jgi:hypothetical protein